MVPNNHGRADIRESRQGRSPGWNPFDIRLLFVSVFMFVLFAGLVPNTSRNQQEGLDYVVMSIVFLLGFFIASKGSGRSANQLLQYGAPEIPTSVVARARLAFLASQIFFLTLTLQLVAAYVSGGAGVMSTLRFDIRNSVSSYIYLPLQFVAISALYVEILYSRQLKRGRPVGSGYFARRHFAAGMLLLFTMQTAIYVSRSILLISAVCFSMALLRGSRRRIRWPTVALVGCITLVLFGTLAVVRLYLDPATFRWWIESGILADPGSSARGWVDAGIAMVRFTFQDIVVRGITVVNAALDGRIEHTLGTVSLFTLYSMLPGTQVHPAVFLNHTLFQTGTDNAIPAPIVSQLFLDFGWWGVCFGGILVGWGLRVSARYAATANSPVPGVLFALFSSHLLLSVYGEFSAGTLVLYAVFGMAFHLWLKGTVAMPIRRTGSKRYRVVSWYRRGRKQKEMVS